MAANETTKMEFAVQMTCKSCEESIRDALNVPGISNVFVDVSNEIVLVDTTLPSSIVQNHLESTGKLVVFRGFGSTSGTTVATPSHHGAAVVAIGGLGRFNGLARMVQVSQEKCVIEGTIDGLEPEQDHLIKIHEYGDLSDNCKNCGEVYGLVRAAAGETGPAAGDLGTIRTDTTGRAVFQMTSEKIKVWDVIGRSMVIHSPSTGTINSLMCGIVARSAGLFQNTKRVCTCDGVTIWDEAEKSKSSRL